MDDNLFGYGSDKTRKISTQTQVIASTNDQKIASIHALSNNRIVVGHSYTISDLITMALVPSSNVATIMLANLISPDNPDQFLDKMNQKSKDLGMTKTKWFNASGAEASSFEGLYNPKRYDKNAFNETTAKDLAILSFHLLKNFPDIITYTKNTSVTVLPGTAFQETFHGYNHSLPGDKYGMIGIDGLKTGSSPHAAYNYVATIKRGPHRLIEVVLGVSNWDDDEGEFLRHPIGNALFEYSLQNYQFKNWIPKGKHIINGKTYLVHQDYFFSIKNGQKPQYEIKNDYLKVINAPDLISPIIKNHVKVRLVKDNKKLPKRNSHFFHWMLLKEKKFPVIFSLFIILVVSFIIIFEKNEQKKRHKKSRS
nr:serine hydrolase [Streptococcus urinalis]